MMRSLSHFLVLLVLAVAIAGIGSGCANIVPPSGGPKDSLPPRLVKVVPRDSSLHFEGNRVNFTFDEYVDLQNPFQEVLISPLPGKTPVINSKLNTVSVKLTDSLKPNTTYTINFRNALKDVNEGNVAKNFSYTFSTGSYLDSLEFSGKVIMAATGGIDSTILVMLHSSDDDSAVIQKKPDYITTLNGKGEFTFYHLPPKTYRVYALSDQGGSYLYLSDKQLFAFNDNPVTISTNTPPVTLYAYLGEQSAATTPAAPLGGNRRNNAADRRMRLSSNLVNGTQDLLSPLIFTFDQPLKYIDSTKMAFFTDTTYTPFSRWHLEQDTANARQATVRINWEENKLYHLVLSKDFAEDTLGRQLLKDDTLTFKTRQRADYGELSIRFTNLDLSKNPVLQFVLQNGTVVNSFPLTTNNFDRDLFLPGDYELRILEDRNKNGRWDAGVFFDQHLQPEIVHPIERRISVKANWKNQFDIAL